MVAFLLYRGRHLCTNHLLGQVKPKGRVTQGTVDPKDGRPKGRKEGYYMVAFLLYRGRHHVVTIFWVR